MQKIWWKNTSGELDHLEKKCFYLNVVLLSTRSLPSMFCSHVEGKSFFPFSFKVLLTETDFRLLESSLAITASLSPVVVSLADNS